MNRKSINRLSKRMVTSLYSVYKHGRNTHISRKSKVYNHGVYRYKNELLENYIKQLSFKKWVFRFKPYNYRTIKRDV